MAQGIKKKPPIIDLIALTFLLAPVLFIFYQFTLSGYAYLNYHRWQWLFTAENTIFIISSLIISYAVYQAKTWGWILAMIYIAAVFVSSFGFLFYSESRLEYTWIIGLLQAISVLMLLVFFSHVRLGLCKTKAER